MAVGFFTTKATQITCACTGQSTRSVQLGARKYPLLGISLYNTDIVIKLASRLLCDATFSP
ncbi:hypothetical protein DTO96_101356 [Ephemeroptericola cinctiostellae]|uniref:Uncharacterized protein n=1 Tax=Ephemeroptericola cinctiostellae TaxID=2268024 RepID=A0A345DB87_9BURK|nr:hypothetical protein DTO96_101356 [Ephemeroptericola cinctiostellae]